MTGVRFLAASEGSAGRVEMWKELRRSGVVARGVAASEFIERGASLPEFSPAPLLKFAPGCAALRTVSPDRSAFFQAPSCKQSPPRLVLQASLLRLRQAKRTGMAGRISGRLSLLSGKRRVAQVA